MGNECAQHRVSLLTCALEFSLHRDTAASSARAEAWVKLLADDIVMSGDSVDYVVSSRAIVGVIYA